MQYIKGTQNVVADDQGSLSCMFSLPSYVPSGQHCALSLDFLLAFTDILPHQLDDEELKTTINKINEGNIKVTKSCLRAVV